MELSGFQNVISLYKLSIQKFISAMIKDIDKLITELTPEQKEYLLGKLRSAVFGGISKDVITCPCCDDDKFIKHGSYKGTPKYLCKTTKKIFSYRSKSILSNITDIEKFEGLMEMMIDKNFPTLEDIQKKIKISSKTALDWRNKIITSLYKEVNFDNQIVEFDETFFRLSRKGRHGLGFGRTCGRKLVGDNNYNVKVFMTYSRSSKKLELYVSHMGKTAWTDVDNYLNVKKNVVVYSDRHRSYKKYFRKRDVAWKIRLS
jgi:transposase-like protein